MHCMYVYVCVLVLVLVHTTNKETATDYKTPQRTREVKSIKEEHTASDRNETNPKDQQNTHAHTHGVRFPLARVTF